MNVRTVFQLTGIVVLLLMLLTGCPAPSDDVVVSGENGSVFVNGALRDLPAVLSVHGSYLKVMPVPDDGYVFDRWDGGVVGTDVPMVIDVFGDLSIRAVFRYTGKPEPTTRPENDDFARAASLSGATGSLKLSTVGATTEPGEPEDVLELGGATLWWTYRPSASGGLQITTAGSDFDTILGVFAGDTLERLVPLAWTDDDDHYDGFSSTVVLGVERDVTYRIAVGGFGGATGLVRLSWDSLF